MNKTRRKISLKRLIVCAALIAFVIMPVTATASNGVTILYTGDIEGQLTPVHG